MEPTLPNASSVGNHGSGSQTLHSGHGSQNINSEGQQFNIQQFQFSFGPMNSASQSKLLADLFANTMPEKWDKLSKLFERDNEDTSVSARKDVVDSKDNMSTGSRNPQLDTHLDGTLVRDILTWLDDFSRVKYSERHRLLLAQSTLGTGNWILEEKEFQEWKENKGGFIWLDGIIGAGKSTLASIVVNHLRNITEETESTTHCAYVYFQDEDEKALSLGSIYAALLSQLLRCPQPRRAISTRLKELLKPLSTESQITEPSPEEFLELLETEGESFSRIFLIVDALDACHSASDPLIQQNFANGVRRLSAKWNVLVTCRTGMLNEKRRESDLKIQVKAQETDVKLYVKARIKTNDELRRLIQEDTATELSLETSIIDAVTQKARGMFLLAKLHLDRLEGVAQHSPERFREMLKELPTNLTNTFDATLQRIEKQDEYQRNVASHVFSWLLASKRPVTAYEVQDAFVTKWTEDTFDSKYILEEHQMTSSCAGIVVIDQKQGLLRPVHEAALEHFKKLAPNPHTELALQCLGYLSFKDLNTCIYSLSEVPKNLPKYALAAYAAEHWFYHIRQAKYEISLQNQLIKFLKNTDAVSTSFRLRDSLFPMGISGLHASAYFGMEVWAKQLIQEGLDVNSAAEDGQTALHWAAHNGHEEFVELLLDHSADGNVQDKKRNTPLHLAVANAHESVVRKLVELEVQLDVQNSQNWTPLRWAIKSGLMNIALVLVQNKAEIDAEDRDGWTALRWAVGYGMFDLIQVMLDHGYNINRQSDDGWTILRHAAQYDNKELMSLLLRNGGLDIELRGKDGMTALRLAIQYGKIEVAEILLEHGADVNAKCNEGKTSLIQATRDGNSSAVDLLLRYGAKLDEQASNGFSALHYATTQTSTSIMCALGERQANINLRDNEGRTAMHYTVHRGDTSRVYFLIEKGADVSIADSSGITPLHLAAGRQRTDILCLLIERIDDINQKDKSGMAALHYAAIEASADAIRVLAQNGADLDAIDECGNTGLHLAARRGHEPTVQALLSCNAKSNIRDSEGRIPLHHAVLGADIETIFRLSSERSNLNVRDNTGKTALIYAAKEGDELATFCLVKKGADLRLSDFEHWSAQDHAANGKYTLVVAVLEEAMGQGLGR